jgi:hypothetical protein
VTYPNHLTSGDALLNKWSAVTIVHVLVLTNNSEFIRALQNLSTIARGVAVTKNTVRNRGHCRIDISLSIVMLRSLQPPTRHRVDHQSTMTTNAASLSNNTVNDTYILTAAQKKSTFAALKKSLKDSSR